MSDSDSFIREVTEEVRQDRLFRWWKRYAPLVFGAIALVVAASAVWNWIQHRERQAALETGAAFLAAEPTPEGRRALLEVVDGPPASVAQMQLAAALMEDGDTAGAIEAWTEVAQTPGLKPAYAHLAELQTARLLAPSVPLARVEAMLAPLAAEDAPYRLLALELRATLRFNAGEEGAAREDLLAILGSSGLTRGLNARALQMLAILGDGGPAEPAPDEPAPDAPASAAPSE